ncbi:MAG UNVERIFIED_CONTAM: hypothetical protein LVT10_12875 [Anaerolineae bacterium]|jgi:hypothetical protein
MMKRFYSWLRAHVQFFTILEATLVITFLIQALRFMLGAFWTNRRAVYHQPTTPRNPSTIGFTWAFSRNRSFKS